MLFMSLIRLTKQLNRKKRAMNTMFLIYRIIIYRTIDVDDENGWWKKDP